MTKQEIFTKVARHLLTQNATSWANGGCAYRGEGGMACAVGCLLEDNEIDLGLEGNRIDTVPTLLVPERLREHIELLARLQGVHDRWSAVYWPDKLQVVANEHCLKMPELDQ